MADQKSDAKSNAVTVALISGVIGVIGIVVTAYFNYLNTRTQIELPIHATQTAEARVFSLTVVPSATSDNQVITNTPVLTSKIKLVFPEKDQKILGDARKSVSFNWEWQSNEIGDYAIYLRQEGSNSWLRLHQDKLPLNYAERSSRSNLEQLNGRYFWKVEVKVGQVTYTSEAQLVEFGA